MYDETIHLPSVMHMISLVQQKTVSDIWQFCIHFNMNRAYGSVQENADPLWTLPTENSVHLNIIKLFNSTMTVHY